VSRCHRIYIYHATTNYVCSSCAPAATELARSPQGPRSEAAPPCDHDPCRPRSGTRRRRRAVLRATVSYVRQGAGWWSDIETWRTPCPAFGVRCLVLGVRCSCLGTSAGWLAGWLAGGDRNGRAPGAGIWAAAAAMLFPSRALHTVHIYVRLRKRP